MVSLWPFGKATDETANFEKTLSTLTTRIQKTNVKRDKLRSSQRRYKALWTLYTTLTYTVCLLILAFVTGWQNWGPVEIAVIAGAPPFIYLVRLGLTTYYTSRLTATQGHLDELNTQRDSAIEKFKAATKYNSTQQLLEKYGAAPIVTPRSSPGRPSPKRRTSSSGGGNSQLRQRQPARTGIAPPATANIRRAPVDPGQHSQTAPTGQTSALPPNYGSPRLASLPPLSTEPSASFAPNAFPSSPQYASAPASSHGHAEARWYDRIMDVLLGEDETRPINRIAMICVHCRLVNGQAPPGVKRLEDIGRWRCAECHQWNGKENEVQRIIQDVKENDATKPDAVKQQGKGTVAEEMTERTRAHLGYDGADDDVFTDRDRSASVLETSPSVEGAEDDEDDVAVENEDEMEIDEHPPAKATRAQTRAGRNKV